MRVWEKKITCRYSFVFLFTYTRTDAENEYVPHLDWVINSCRSTIRITMTQEREKMCKHIRTYYTKVFIILNETDASNIQTHECGRIFCFFALGHRIISFFFFLLFTWKLKFVVLLLLCVPYASFTTILFPFSHLFLAPCFDCEPLCWFWLIYLYEEKKTYHVISFKVRITYQSNVKC